MWTTILLGLKDVALVIVGALVGAWIAYRYGKKQQEEARADKRHYLLNTLLDETLSIQDSLQPFDPAKVFWCPIIQLPPLSRFLEEDLLEYKQHAALIGAILTLHTLLGLYNTRVGITNLAQNVNAIPDNIHLQMYGVVAADYAKVVASRNRLIQALRDSKLIPWRFPESQAPR